MHRPKRSLRPGMTLIEVMFAIVILSGVMLALSRFGQGFAKANRNAANFAIASDLAAARVEVVRGHGNFATLASTFNGTTETSATVGANPPMSGYPGFTRQTAVTYTSTDTTDYATVTVTVSSSLLTKSVQKTRIISAF